MANLMKGNRQWGNIKTSRLVRRGNSWSDKNPDKGNSSNKPTKAKMEATQATLRYHRWFPPNIKEEVE
jgi:hypothetical protein